MLDFKKLPKYEKRKNSKKTLFLAFSKNRKKSTICIKAINTLESYRSTAYSHSIKSYLLYLINSNHINSGQ